jgi:hypothetical protein
MRRRHDRLDPRVGRSSAQIHCLTQLTRTVIDTGEAVVMDVDHGSWLFSRSAVQPFRSAVRSPEQLNR